MGDLVVRRPRVTDVLQLATGLRDADAEEVRALGHADVRLALADAIRRSAWSFTVLDRGRVVCVFGVADRGTLLSTTGLPWLLGTDLMLRHRSALMRWAPGYIAAMHDLYPRLENVVHARNTKAVAWLRRMGFVLADAENYGPLDEPFHRFHSERR